MNEKLHDIRERLLDILCHHSFTNALFTIFDNLEDVGDDDVSYSDGNLGFNITQDKIEIVDIDAGKALATITITV